MNYDEFLKQHELQERIREDLARELRKEGIPLSHIVFQLAAEDIVDVLAEMVMEGRFEADEYLPTLIAEIEDVLDEAIDWRPVIKALVFESIFEEKLAQQKIHQDEGDK